MNKVAGMDVDPDSLHRMETQHERLGELVKKSCQVLSSGQGPLEFSGSLENLVEFTRFHFTEEEAFMRCHSYGKWESHKRTHEMLFKRLVELKEKTFIFDEPSKARMLSFLEKDFCYHIIEDQHIWKNWQRRGREK